ncbi:hypothetical protein CDL15_Pgr009447 [Punica granatum]|uniref:GCF C-terminal domain-containing protein n=1 Tax=Punica granatum TaxID=22663 RepID=A0A218WT33_PUNGR|nr:hypothetical protein CDL15_Pgr009447 [Punica granatum]PKI60506.1 hypothetical protein CRG98_019160 [Punica granatum]
MSSARAKNFRRRGGDDGDEDANGETTPAAAATAKPLSKATSTSKPQSKPKKPPGSKLLSFADDEEASETVTLPKPSSSRPNKPVFSSRKTASVKDRSAPSSLPPSNVLPQAGTYTKEALLELQKNTRTLASSSKPDPKPEPVIVLKGPLKPQVLTEERAEKPRGEQVSEIDDDLEEKILDQAMIQKIRAERERKRQSREAPQFIPLESGRSTTLEELSDEEPEFQGRIPMFGERTDGVKKGVFESFHERPVEVGSKKENRLEDDDDDEAEKEWEEEQVKKGLLKRIDESASRGGVNNGSSSIGSVPVMPQQFGYSATNVNAAPPPPPLPIPSIGGAVGSAAQGLEGLSISQQAELATKAMLENARRLRETHARTALSLSKTDENLSASLLNINALEKSLEAAGEKYIFMQKLRDYISVICKFLQDKAPYIEELEEQMQKLNEERASTVVERRAANNDDEMTEIEVAVNAAMAVFRKGDSSAATVAAATASAQAAIAAMKEQTNLPVKLDEFGRDKNLQKRMDINRRAEARQRRKARFEAKRHSSMDIDGTHQKIEGESSTDESDSESKAYQSNRELLLQTADQIFDDTADEYAQLSEVKERFEKWKRDYSSSYRDAYMSLSIPNIFSPYVRLELLKWDPLHEDSDFFDMKWHSLLFNYGLPVDGSDFTPEDADANLVPGLVEKVALPILHHKIAHCWDMLSLQETRNAVSATTLVINYVSTSSEALGELLVAIRARLTDAIANLVVPTWSPLVLKAVPSAARLAAYRFGMSVRLMRNICLWKEILALPVLEKLALDELLSGKILPHVRSIASDIHDAVTRTERVVASMSGVWAGPSIIGQRSQKLQPLVDYVLLLGQALQKKHSSGVTEVETNGLARRLKKMLVELNEYHCARELAKAFHLREAL